MTHLNKTQTSLLSSELFFHFQLSHIKLGISLSSYSQNKGISYSSSPPPSGILTFFFLSACPLLVIYTYSSIKSALLQYCPAANAKCFKYYKTAKESPISAYSSGKKGVIKCTYFLLIPFPTRLVALPPLLLRKKEKYLHFFPLKR